MALRKLNLTATPTDSAAAAKVEPGKLRSIGGGPKNFAADPSPTAPRQVQSARDPREQEIFDIKSRLHQSLIEIIDLDLLLTVDRTTAQKQIERLASDLIRNQAVPLTADERERIIREVVDETFGLGPLEPLISDPTIDEILVNNFQTVYVERKGKLEATNVRFKDEQHLRHIINRIVAKVGRRIDEASPMVDARLQDGSRVNVVIPPLALDGSCLSIRKFRAKSITVDELIRYGTMSTEFLEILKFAVEAKINILISGGTGSGKTTLLNTLSSFIPKTERIVTSEDAAELRLQQPHVVRLETRPANVEGKGLVAQRDLVRNALRMRPDRIIVGEVRGAEALDMLQAMNTGHEGSMTTIHSNTPRDALSRIETMVLLGAANLDQRSINKQIASAINIVVQIKRFPDGKRRIDSIVELMGMEGNVVTMQSVASFVVEGRNADGTINGSFKIDQPCPKFFERGLEMGLKPPILNAEERAAHVQQVKAAKAS
jgi:pilus assembly protein CpaF